MCQFLSTAAHHSPSTLSTTAHHSPSTLSSTAHHSPSTLSSTAHLFQFCITPILYLLSASHPSTIHHFQFHISLVLYSGAPFTCIPFSLCRPLVGSISFWSFCRLWRGIKKGPNRIENAKNGVITAKPPYHAI